VLKIRETRDFLENVIENSMDGIIINTMLRGILYLLMGLLRGLLDLEEKR